MLDVLTHGNQEIYEDFLLIEQENQHCGKGISCLIVRSIDHRLYTKGEERVG